MKPLLSLLPPLAFGLLFGFGLIVSGMVDTNNVKGFLYVAGIWAGTWRPALAFVMGAAILIALPLFQWTRRRGRPLLAEAVETPPAIIDVRLIAGAAIFGVGWGLSGICPGPAIVWLGLSPQAVAPFLLAVIAGTLLAGLFRPGAESAGAIPPPSAKDPA